MEDLGSYKRLPIQNPIDGVLIAIQVLGHDKDDYRKVYCEMNYVDVVVSLCRNCDECKGIGNTQVLCRYGLFRDPLERLNVRLDD